MKRSIVLTATACAVLAQGCYGFPDDGDEYASDYVATPSTDFGTTSDPYFDDAFDDQLQITNARLAGTMGEVRGFDTVAFETSGYSYEGFSQFHVTVEHRGDFAMAQLNVDANVSALAVGTDIDLENGTSPEIGYASAVACSGPDNGSWTFDVGANLQRVRVQAGTIPTRKRVEFELDVQGELVRGSFELPSDGSRDLGEADVTAGTLEGSFGTARNFRGEATWVSDIHRPGLSTVIVELDAVRTRLDITGGLELFTAPESTSFTDASDAAGRLITVSATVGSDSRVAKEVQIDVEPIGERLYRMRYVATFDAAGSTEAIAGELTYTFE